MKKSLKIALYSLLGLIVVLAIVVSIALYLVFTPERITPIVRNQVEKQVSCEIDLDYVELTFFSTFPHFGLKVHDFSLIHPMKGAPSDTLVSMESLVAKINVEAFLKDNAIVVNQCLLNNPQINVFVDSLGLANYDILPPSEKEESVDTESSFDLNVLFVEDVIIKNARMHYLDLSTGMKANVGPLNTDVKGLYQDQKGDFQMNLVIDQLSFLQKDSVDMQLQVHPIECGLNLQVDTSGIGVNLDLNLDAFTVMQGESVLLDSSRLHTTLFAFVDKDNKVRLEQSTFSLNDFDLSLSGDIQTLPDEKIAVDMRCVTPNAWSSKELLALVPETFKESIQGLKVEGGVTFDTHIKGLYYDSIMPQVTTLVALNDFRIQSPDIPYTLRKLNTKLTAFVDMNAESYLTIHDFEMLAGKNKVSCTGQVDDLMDSIYCNLDVRTSLNLQDINHTLKPMGKDLTLSGKVVGNTQLKFYVDDVVNARYNKMKVSSKQTLTDLDVLYQDTIGVQLSQTALALKIPSTHTSSSFEEWLALKIDTDVDAQIVGTGDVHLKGMNLNIGVGDFAQTKRAISMRVDYDLNQIEAEMDSMQINVQQPKGRVWMTPSRYASKEYCFKVAYQNNSLGVVQPGMRLLTEKIDAHIKSEFDPNQSNEIAKLRPSVSMSFNNGLIGMDALTSTIEIPTIEFDLTPTQMVIQDSQLKIDESDFSLKGSVTQIQEYLNKEGLLKADLDFVSNTTNVTQLMNMVSGAGSDSTDSLVAENTVVTTESSQSVEEDQPFMVPLGVDVTLRTQIKQALYDANEINDVKGTLICKDGTLVLEQMGFTNKAAEMQLTALYRSKRKNHLFVGMDFHLLNVDVHELVQMIPDVDTVVPMLAEFDGRGEFHFAVETYLKSNYDLKYSTLRGAAAFEGKDLVLLDSETFGTISKYLMLKKSTVNKIDSLDVQMTIFRNEIDLYPFQIAMGKYKAVIEGRHTMENNCNYKISVTQTPLPVRLALQVKGPMDDLKYKVVPCEYKNLYNPKKQNKLEKQTQYFKKLISDALKRNVK